MQISNIDKDDYFVKNAEFTAWLRDQRGTFFNELDSDQARSLFGMSACHQLQNILAETIMLWQGALPILDYRR